MRRNRLAVVVACWSVVFGGACIVAAEVLPNPHITAVPVEATVEPSPAGSACASQGAVDLSFPWQNRLVTGVQFLENDCETYRVGDHVVVYVESDDSTVVATQPSAILDPSTVNPFNFLGPNDLNGFLGFLGAVSLTGGAVVYLAEGRRRLSSKPPSQAPSS